MDTLFDNLEHYSKLIGQGKFSLVVTMWVFISLLVAVSIRYLVGLNIEKLSNSKRIVTAVKKTQMLGIAGVEYLFDCICAFIMISLFQSEYPIWNFLVAPGIGFIVGLVGEIIFLSKYQDKLKSSREKNDTENKKNFTTEDKKESSTSVTNITITNNEELGDKQEMRADGLSDVVSKFKKNKQTKQNIVITTAETPSTETSIEQAVQDLAAGLVSTVEVVQDIANQLTEFKTSLDKIEDRINSIDRSITKIDENSAEDKAIQCRVRILRFNIDLIIASRSGEKMPKDLFEQTLIDIDIYDNYCKAHPDFRNKITAAAEKHILAEYDKGLEEGFLTY